MLKRGEHKKIIFSCGLDVKTLRSSSPQEKRGKEHKNKDNTPPQPSHMLIAQESKENKS